MRSSRRHTGLYATIAACVALLVGCTITVGPPTDNGGSGGGSEGEITIRLVNRANVTLDPQLYISSTPTSVDSLFSSSRKFTAFGVGTLGLLAPDSSDSFSLGCDELRVVGTRGGSFGDDLNNPEGQGRQLVLTQDLNIFCGSVLTLTYRRSGDGFETTFDIE